MKSLRLAASIILAVALPRAAHGADAVAQVPPAAGHPAMAVGVDARGIVAAACAASPCSVASATPVPIDEAARGHVAEATLRIARVGRARAVVVSVPTDAPGERFEAVVVPGRGARAEVLFAGKTGYVDGIEGERSGARVEVRDGTVYVGEQREHRTLCGRPVLLAPRAVDPKSLTLKPAKLQRLSREERASAPVLGAVPSTGQSRASGALVPVWATSAAEGHLPAAATDGTLDTAWVEGRGADGRGELLVLNAPPEVPLRGLSIGVPGPGDASGLVAPRELWLALDTKLFHVSLPTRSEARELDVTFPEPVKTRCVAVVLERGATASRNAGVGISEVTALTDLGGLSPDALVQKLDAEPAVAEAAGAALRVGGPGAFEAVAKAFGKLGEGGRRIALDVMDHAPCEQSVPTYVEALLGPHPAHRAAARERLRTCGRRGADALVAALDHPDEKLRVLVAQELCLSAPAVAVPALAKRLGKASRSLRRAYRVALGLASRTPEGRRAFDEVLGGGGLGRIAQLDLLRALSAGAQVDAGVARAFTELSGRDDFRTRYLLVGVASRLDGSVPGAKSFLQAMLAKGAEPHVRAEAIRRIRHPEAYGGLLVAALGAEDVRVREAAVQTLGGAGAAAATPALVERLRDDPWPLVRGAAALALGKAKTTSDGSDVDDALEEALEDDAPDVRRRAVLALGRRLARDRAESILERLDDTAEQPAVRAAAALSLGMMCYRPATARLTEYARGLESPRADATVRAVGRSAVAALGILHPPDLSERLAPLLTARIPGVYQGAARDALAATRICRPVRKAP